VTCKFTLLIFFCISYIQATLVLELNWMYANGGAMDDHCYHFTLLILCGDLEGACEASVPLSCIANGRDQLTETCKLKAGITSLLFNQKLRE
jgi:hypothetical protein